MQPVFAAESHEFAKLSTTLNIRHGAVAQHAAVKQPEQNEEMDKEIKVKHKHMQSGGGVAGKKMMLEFGMLSYLVVVLLLTVAAYCATTVESVTTIDDLRAAQC